MLGRIRTITNSTDAAYHAIFNDIQSLNIISFLCPLWVESEHAPYRPLADVNALLTGVESLRAFLQKPRQFTESECSNLLDAVMQLALCICRIHQLHIVELIGSYMDLAGKCNYFQCERIHL